MQVIDFERKGNVIRFYLGEKTKDWGWTNKEYKDSTGKTPDWLKPSDTYYGDDWNDKPYEHNAGEVYNEFIKGQVDFYVPFEMTVIDPSFGTDNSQYCKDDMVDKKIPCVILISNDLYEETWYNHSFADYCNEKSAIKIYFEDSVEKLIDIQYNLIKEIPLLNK